VSRQGLPRLKFTGNRLGYVWRAVFLARLTAEIRQQLLLEFKDLIDQGLLKLPAPEREMKEIKPKE
jgi:hypothetical protein